MPFSQSTSQAVCVLSANGSISNVSLWQAATSGGTVTYEGRLDILTLSGSFSRNLVVNAAELVGSLQQQLLFRLLLVASAREVRGS
ncbi:hypothetical protein K7X08_019944 [Anisodus acutangulus]|uniref:AT-hook motif nuclear-localized protein n=1 Tax=Anisodus acutangulus TaxID=402998 RepID=A0A9Q1RR42_9SOLA|nr:hypothetical protein K7X08_019944 [Anisodus acutangulus]